MTCMGAHISLNTHPDHTSREVWARGAKCRGPFFRSTADQVQKPRRFALRAQNPSGPVICGSKNIKRNGFQPSIKPRAQKRNPAHSILKLRFAAMTFKEHLKQFKEKRGKWLPRDAHFSLLFWCGARDFKECTFPR
jgi:hypothetical protein